ncbi:hypothetical protein [Actinomadura flavalba]|uniref:hypothetical protein n=1 Tax=Actinomadura flavalba TaxID=1120938 RepID=UPI000361127A|nr:hypothetical protein [Actinomadura flavalba]
MKRERGPLAVVLAVLAVALAGVAVWVGLAVHDRAEADEQRTKAAQTARQFGVNLNSLDHEQAQRDLDRILAVTTGGLKDTLASQSKTLLDQLAKTKAKSTVSEPIAAVVAMDGDSAEVMVSMNAVVTNDKVKNAAPRPWRCVMDLERKDGRWLVAKMELVP